mgnify:CR=1 FL=1
MDIFMRNESLGHTYHKAVRARYRRKSGTKIKTPRANPLIWLPVAGSGKHLGGAPGDEVADSSISPANDKIMGIAGVSCRQKGARDGKQEGAACETHQQTWPVCDQQVMQAISRCNVARGQPAIAQSYWSTRFGRRSDDLGSFLVAKWGYGGEELARSWGKRVRMCRCARPKAAQGGLLGRVRMGLCSSGAR